MPDDLMFNPELINTGANENDNDQPDNGQESEELNLFKDPLFEDQEEEEDSSNETDKEDAPDPDDIKDGDEPSSEESVFSVVLGQELMDGGVLSTFDKDAISKIEQEEGRGAAIKAMIESQSSVINNDVKSSYDSEFQDYMTMRQGGVPKEEANEIQQLKDFSKSISGIDLKDEGEESAQARKNLLTLDYRLNTKFSEERIQKLVEKAYDEGTDLEDVDEAKSRVSDYIKYEEQRALNDAKNAELARTQAQEKQVNDLNSQVDNTKEYFKGEEVSSEVKAEMKKLLTTPVKLSNGTVTSELWAERDKDPNKFDAGIAYLKAIGYFDGKPLEKFMKNATTKATSNLDTFLNDNKGRNFSKSSGRSFSSNSGNKKDFLDF